MIVINFLVMDTIQIQLLFKYYEQKVLIPEKNGKLLEGLHMEEELTIEQLAEGNNMVLNVLIDFLIEKGVIGEDEFRQKLESATQSVPEETAQAAEIEKAAIEPDSSADDKPPEA